MSAILTRRLGSRRQGARLVAMRAVSWNAQHGRPNPDGEPDIGRAVAPLRALQGDVYAIQELDRGRRRSGRADQPQALACGLGAALMWAPALERGGQYGVALVVRGEVMRHRVRSVERCVGIEVVRQCGSRWVLYH